MRLEISGNTIATAIRPYQFSIIDVISIMPRLTVGDFECCVINLVCNKTLIIANGLIMVYNKLEDFMNGFEPISLVSDETIHYSQELTEVDFKITSISFGGTVDNEAFNAVRELMFGAREDDDEAASDVAQHNDEVISQ